jgi:hypothetical protein
MNNYKDKAVKIYLNFFLKDRVSDFENRIVKAKTDAMIYVQKEISLKNNSDDLFFWSNVKNALEKI